MPSTPSLHSLEPKFSHIYIEQKALAHPKTQDILNRFKKAKTLTMGHYKDLFNQKGQDFRLQKRSPKLILALKEPPYLYEGSQYADGFGFEKFYYTPSMLNCLYDCEYCYLQGLYQSANIVVFVNHEDFMQDTLKHLEQPTLVCTSYDTDLLAMEELIGENRAWIAFAAKHPNLHLEIRTKSANYKAISDLKPSKQVVLAWSLAPQEIISRYESKTPSLNKRLQSIEAALHDGWLVRLCLDPVIYTPNYQSLYSALIEEIFSRFKADTIFEMTLGTFRMSSAHLKALKKMQHSDLAFFEYRIENQMASYPKDLEREIMAFLTQKILHYLPKERLRLWETSS